MNYFLHGLLSSPQGDKSLFLKQQFPSIQTPDFSNLPPDLNAWVEHAQRVILEPGFIVGSSFGGLVAVVLADRFPDLVRGYILCAPALHRPHPEVRIVPHYTYMIRGTKDDIVPYGTCADFSQQFRIPFQQVDDDHRLNKPETLRLIVDMMGQIKREYANDSKWE